MKGCNEALIIKQLLVMWRPRLAVEQAHEAIFYLQNETDSAMLRNYLSLFVSQACPATELHLCIFTLSRSVVVKNDKIILFGQKWWID